MNEQMLRKLKPWGRRVRAAKVVCFRVFQGFFRLFGLNIVRARDFYSPLPVIPDLRRTRARWDRPSRLSGIRYEVEGMKRVLTTMSAAFCAEFDSMPSYDVTKKLGFGPGFTPVDARIQYYMLRDAKPANYLEVGSGLSTYYASLAGARNAQDGRPMQIRCIEPFPYPKLHSIQGIELIRKEVQDVELAEFTKLGAGDVLFIDSTHIVRIDGDVPYLLLEVLPELKPGVMIHVHDVPFPFNTPYPADQWVFGMPWPMYWTEAMLLQALLCNNPAFEIAFSAPLIRHHDESFLRGMIPGYQGVREDPKTFCSLWLRKIA